MTNLESYRQVVQLLGTNLVEYFLNAENGSIDQGSLRNYELNPLQREILDIINNRLKEYSIAYAYQGNLGDTRWLLSRNLVHDTSIDFNHFRAICGGDVLKIDFQGDPLLTELINRGISFYPFLLMKGPIEGMAHIHVSLPGSKRGMEAIKELIEKDKIYALAKNGSIEYCINTGAAGGVQIELFDEILIKGAFRNCCYRMKYSLVDLQNEIKDLLDKLRDEAEGNTPLYSYFVGLKGLRVEGEDPLEISDITVRNIDSLFNPNSFVARNASTHTDDNNSYVTGCIVEFKEITRNITKEADYKSKWREEIDITREQIQVRHRAIQLASTFALGQDRGPQESTFESGYPLCPGNGGYTLNNKPLSVTYIKEDNIEEFKRWYIHFISNNINNIKQAVTRTSQAILERSNPEDSIVDAVIAWESIFSGKSETVFKVTSSIFKFLTDDTDDEEFYKKLKELYACRSDIVHGKKSKYIEREGAESVRKEVLEINRMLLMKIFRDRPDLLEMTAPERVKSILLKS